MPFDTFDTDNGMLHTCEHGSGLVSSPGTNLDTRSDTDVEHNPMGAVTDTGTGSDPTRDTGTDISDSNDMGTYL